MRRVRKYLGAYFVHLRGDVDAIVFSAGGRRGWEGRDGRCWAGVRGMPPAAA